MQKQSSPQCVEKPETGTVTDKKGLSSKTRKCEAMGVPRNVVALACFAYGLLHDFMLSRFGELCQGRGVLRRGKTPFVLSIVVTNMLSGLSHPCENARASLAPLSMAHQGQPSSNSCARSCLDFFSCLRFAQMNPVPRHDTDE